MEGGYICRDKFRVKLLYYQRNLYCRDFVETKYYNPITKNPKKGDRIITDNIYDILYSPDDILSRYDIKNNNLNVGGNNPFLLCRHCYESNIKSQYIWSKSIKYIKRNKRKK